MKRSLEARALAAEKTVEVLKRKVKSLCDGGGSDGFTRQLQEARERRQRMVAHTRALEAYSAKLELEVAARTREIKTILDNVTFGFLIVDREFRVQPGFTRSCAELLETSVRAGADLPGLFGVAREVDRQHAQLALDQVFEDLLPEEVSLHQLPKRFVLPSGRVLRVDGRTVRDASDDVQGVLFSLSDITSLEAARRQSETNGTLVAILQEKEAFRAFISDARDLFAGARHALRGGDDPTARHALHTIKGNAASYRLHDLVDMIHAVEEHAILGELQLDRVEEELEGFLQQHRNVLQIEGDAAYQVTSDHLARLDSIMATLSPRAAEALEAWSASVCEQPAYQFLGPIEGLIARLADRLGKLVDLEMVGVDAPVDAQRMGPIFGQLSHLVRNAVDHGIERPGARGDKADRGRIVLRIDAHRDAYVIELSDDGRGVDVGRLRARAAALGLCDPAALEGLTYDELLPLVFVDRLSQTEEATAISGRGVGMSAVKAAVERVGGDIVIESRLSQGTRVRLTVPRAARARA